jgi:hypothetical protein
VAAEIIVTSAFEQWFETLSLAEQASIVRVIGLLEEKGPALAFPFSSGIQGSRFAMRELRVQHRGEPYRILYAFDPVRRAVLLVGGVKSGIGNRWYDKAIKDAERLWVEYLRGE